MSFTTRTDPYSYRQSSVYPSAAPSVRVTIGESGLLRITKAILPILAALVTYMVLPSPLGLILGSAIAVSGLFFGGFLNGDTIKTFYASIRPPRASLFNEEVNPPPPRVTPSYGSVRMSYAPRSTPVFQPVPEPRPFVRPLNSERKEENEPPPPPYGSLEREPVNAAVSVSRKPSIAPPPYPGAP